MMNGTEFAQFKKESYEDKPPVPVQFQTPEEYGEGWSIYDALLRKAPIQDYSLNFSSSKENLVRQLLSDILIRKVLFWDQI